jgi:asparagine synthase (glutamine-hydrolysing)
MCGITGIIGKPNLSDLKLSQTRSACSVLSHRGPDNEGFHVGSGWSFGHRRLSIIDPTGKANQPMTSADGNFIIIFNGEIYNHNELRKQHFNSDFQFKTKSDTETLLESFASVGPKILNELNGFFAFCIYSKKDDSFFLARDRYGIKPLIYSEQDDFFAFGSEIKSILEYKVRKEIDSEALGTYLQYSYIPTPRTIYKGISKLEPGHCIEIDNERNVTKTPYYQISTEPIKSDVSFADASLQVNRMVMQSVEKRLLSDVPVGSFLSGGVDSSIIAYCANKIKPIETFSIGFKDEPTFDESIHARKVAKHIGSKHHEIEISNDDLLETQEVAEQNLDEPFADSSSIAVNALSKFTRNHVTVALSGDGADEIFSGYNKHEGLYRSMNPGIKTSILKAAVPILKNLPSSRESGLGNVARKAKKFDAGLKLNLTDRYALWAKFTQREVVRNLLLDFKEIPQNVFIPDLNNFNDILKAECNLVLQNDMLKKVDSMSMLNSLEVRTPFLDHQLVDYVFSLPEEYKINSNGRKLLLKSAFKQELPEEIFARKKHGFEVPLTTWFEGPLKNKLKKLLLNKDLLVDQGLFNFDEVSKLFQQGIKANRDTIWAILQFQIWYFEHFNR